MIESVLTVSSICRVLYFIGSVFVGEVLNLVMRLRKADKVSTGLGSIAAIGLWSVLPLADSIPQEMIGPKRLRIMLVIAIIIKAYYLGWCKVLCILVHASVHACMHACMCVRSMRPSAMRFTTTSAGTTRSQQINGWRTNPAPVREPKYMPSLRLPRCSLVDSCVRAHLIHMRACAIRSMI